MQFHLLYTVHFSLSPRFHRFQNSCITLAIIQYFATISYPSQKVRSSYVITNKKLPSITQIYKFTATPTCYNAKQPHLSPIKITFTYNFFQWAQRRHNWNMLFQQNRSSRESSRCIMQGLISPHWMPNPAPQPSNNLRQLPHAVGLERSLHGITQSRILTNFHTLHHENKGRLVLLHYPSKLSKSTYNKLTKTNYKT